VAATITFDSRQTGGTVFSGSEKLRRGTGNLGTYTGPGGVAITPALFNLKRLDHLDLQAVGGAHLFVFDKAAMKIKAYSAFGTEVTNGTNITANTFRFQAQGR
jgi:hypothetical protein